MKKLFLFSIAAMLVFSLQGCVGMIVGAAVDTAIEVAKVPFKVGGAIIDVATGGKDDKESKVKEDKK
jgi:hypothetical protein